MAGEETDMIAVLAIIFGYVMFKIGWSWGRTSQEYWHDSELQEKVQVLEYRLAKEQEKNLWRAG